MKYLKDISLPEPVHDVTLVIDQIPLSTAGQEPVEGLTERLEEGLSLNVRLRVTFSTLLANLRNRN